MRKRLLFLLIGIVILLLAACGNEGSDSGANDESGSGESITLVMNNHAPATHHLAVNAFDPWKEYVEEKTNNRIIIDLYHGGTLGDASSAYDDIVGNSYDIGIPPSDYTEDTSLFAWTLSDLPFVFTDPKLTSEVVSEVLEEYALEQMDDNLVYLGTAGLDPSMIISRENIEGYDDITKMSISAASKIVNDLIKEWGATPVSLPYSETYEALQRKTTDGVVYTGAGSLGMSYYEVATNYVNDVHPTTGTLPLVMNKEVYDSIPEDLKEVFDNDLAPKLIELMNESYISEMEEFREYLEGENINFIDLPSEDIEKLKEPGKIVWDEWAERANAKGYDGDAIINRTMELLEERDVDISFMK